MLLITGRPENQPEFPALPHFTSLSLNRLGRSGVEEIVARLGGDKLPPATIAAIPTNQMRTRRIAISSSNSRLNPRPFPGPIQIPTSRYRRRAPSCKRR